MSTDAVCTLRVGKDTFEGKARIDADQIDFWGETKFRFRLSEIREPAFDRGALHFDFHGNKIALSVGDRTVKWYDAVVHPKTPAQKMGLRSGARVRLIAIDDDEIVRSLADAGVQVIRDRHDELDAILLGAERGPDLRQVPNLAEQLAPAGALWIIIPKTARGITQGNVTAAARAGGLGDVSQASVSLLHSAYRLARRVIKPARRRVRA